MMALLWEAGQEALKGPGTPFDGCGSSAV
jgi:hypothetical protein